MAGALGTVPVSADILWRLGALGMIYSVTDADQNDTVTGQTSFAATTPTFLLDVPVGVTVVPLGFDLSQSGSVAGGDITVLIEIDGKKRYSTGGTEETNVKSLNTGQSPTPRTKLYSGATAFAGYGATIFRVTLAPDVSPAEGAVQGPFWTPPAPVYLVGPSTLQIFTYAAATAPTWQWSCIFSEIATDDLPKFMGWG